MGITFKYLHSNVARTKLEEDLLAMLAAERQRNASGAPDTGLPDLPPGLFGEEPNAPRTKQASTSPLSADAYLDFLKPPSPGRNVADVGLDSLWATPEPVQPKGYGALPPPNAPIPGLEPLAPTQANVVEDSLSSLWSTEPTASSEEPDLQSLWDTPGRTTIADDAGDALSNLFMNRDAQAQAEMTGQPTEYGDIPMPQTRTASRGNEFTIEFDSEINFDSPVRHGGGGGSGPRFRVDQSPPPRRAFDSRVAASADGVVVGQRGSDGRFRTAAQQPRTSITRMAPPPTTRGEAIQRHEAKVAAATPPPAPARPAPAPTTTYDVISRGGLDI